MSGFHVEEIEGERFVTCAVCESDAEWVDCENCDGGYTGHDCGEDTCCCADPEENVVCDICGGGEGWYRCTNPLCTESPARPDTGSGT